MSESTDKELTVEESMKLPEGKTCADCAHLRRCQALFQCEPSNTGCDWAPSRFREKCNND